MRRVKNHIIVPLIFFISVIYLSSEVPQLKVSVKDYPVFSRTIIESVSPLSVLVEKSSSMVVVRIRPVLDYKIKREPFESNIVKSIGWAKSEDSCALTIQTNDSDFSLQSYRLNSPPQLIIDIIQKNEKKNDSKLDLTQRENVSESSEASGSFSAALNSPSIRTIVIDPGHGGLESGAKGKYGALEKDITLDIGLKLREIFQKSMAHRVIMTREEDIDVPLESRAAIANNNRADLFISIHVNSSYRKEASGSETFFLSLNATDEEARRLAYLENNSSELQAKIGERDEDDTLKMILWDMAQSAYLKQSSQLAESIQKQLNTLLGTANRGIKQAPFKVLTGVACPAVLVEVAFLSNSEEEKKLLTEIFQEKVAQAIHRGIIDFLRNHQD